MHEIKDIHEAHLLMQIAMYAGSIMLKNGAEIYRVEDTIERMLGSCQNISEIEAISTYSYIIISFIYRGEIITRVNKIKNITTNLSKISEVNDFSRRFVADHPDLDLCYKELKAIDKEEGISGIMRIATFSIASAVFTLYVGGSILDFFAALIIVAISQIISLITANQGRKYFMDTLLSSLIVSSLAIVAYELGLKINYNTVITGSIFLLFPGVSLTNSVRDFMNRDLLSGTIGLLQAIFVAGALAIGVSLMIYLHSQVI